MKGLIKMILLKNKNFERNLGQIKLSEENILINAIGCQILSWHIPTRPKKTAKTLSHQNKTTNLFCTV